MFFGWWVVGCTFLMALWGWGLGFYGLSIYLVALQQQNHWSSATVSFAITAYYLLGALLVTGLSDAMRRIGPRRTVLGGIAAMGGGVYALTWVTAPWQMHAAFALMAVGWCTLTIASINILLAPWFERRRGVAISLALTGATCGGIFVAPLLLAATGAFGFRGGIGLTVGIMLVTLVPAVLATLRHTPASLGLRPDGEPGAPAASAAAAPSPVRSPAPGDSRGTRAQALRSARYWTISLPFALGIAAQVGVLTHFIAFLAPIYGNAGAGVALSVTTFSALVGRFAVGALIDRFNLRALTAAVIVTQALGLSLLFLDHSPVTLYAGCLLFGFGVGNLITLPGLLVHREFRADQFARIISLVVATNQVTFAFAPGILGVLRDATGDYQAALLLCIGLELLGAAVVLAGYRFGKRAPSSHAAALQ